MSLLLDTWFANTLFPSTAYHFRLSMVPFNEEKFLIILFFFYGTFYVLFKKSLLTMKSCDFIPYYFLWALLFHFHI